MAFLKTINGHTGLQGTFDYLHYGEKGTQNYLEKNDRALAVDTFNMFLKDESDWARVMDNTRKLNGNDKAHGKRKSVTYRHFIVSPDPKDNINLETLRQLVHDWVEKEFGTESALGTYEVAVVYHDDNKERKEKGLDGVVHAHIIVNNTNLNNGKKLQIRSPRALAQDLQKIAKEYGLSHFDIDDEVKSLEGATREHIRSELKTLGRLDRQKTIVDYRPSQLPQYLTRKERELAAEGKMSWKQELRYNIDIACNCCQTIEEVHFFLESVGIKCKPNSKGTDYIYYPVGVDPYATKIEQLQQFAVAHELTDMQKKQLAYIEMTPEEQSNFLNQESKTNKKFDTSKFENIGYAAFCSGARLGAHYSVNGIKNQIKNSYYRKLEGDDRDEAGVRNVVASINKLEVQKGVVVSLDQVAKAFAVISGNSIQTLQEATKLKNRYMRTLQYLESDKSTAQDKESLKSVKQEIENLDALISLSKVTNILPKTERQAKTMPKNTQSRREEAKTKNATIKQKIAHGWDLTREERNGLKPAQLRQWQRNRVKQEHGAKLHDASQTQKQSTTSTDSKRDQTPMQEKSHDR